MFNRMPPYASLGISQTIFSPWPLAHTHSTSVQPLATSQIQFNPSPSPHLLFKTTSEPLHLSASNTPTSLCHRLTEQSLQRWSHQPGIGHDEQLERETLALKIKDQATVLSRARHWYNFFLPRAEKPLFLRGDLRINNFAALKSLPEGLEIEGHLWIDNCTALTCLPQGLNIHGNLSIHRCPALTSLSTGLHVGYNLSIESCPALFNLPQGLQVGHTLSINHCAALTTLPQSMNVAYKVWLNNCPSLTHLPEVLKTYPELAMGNCPTLTSLPQGLKVQRCLWLHDCPAILGLPQTLQVGDDLILFGCTQLVSLPHNLCLGGRLIVSKDCPIQQFPHNIKLLGHVTIDAPKPLLYHHATTPLMHRNYILQENLLKATGRFLLPESKYDWFPSKLLIEGHFKLKHCMNTERLPLELLVVGGTLIMIDCPKLQVISDHLIVQGGLHLSQCKSLVHLATKKHHIQGSIVLKQPNPALFFGGFFDLASH